MRVLVVEDNELEAEIVMHSLRQFGYLVTWAQNGREALELIHSGQFRLVVSDWEMPEMTGIEMCREVRESYALSYVYIILLTSRSNRESVIEGLDAGADDFIAKPADPNELLVRIRAGERVLSLEARDLIIFSMAKLAESRDPETGAHLERMRNYCRILAQEMSEMPDFRGVIDGSFVQMIYLTSPLHDIGKVGISDNVLLKEGPLTPEEYNLMKEHTTIGGATLDAAVESHPHARYLKMARDIAWTHHERFDGSGYPNGLKGEEIPLCGRIVSVADVYDALTVKRVYKRAFSHEKAKELLLAGAGTQFDPRVIEAFMRREAEIIEIKRQLNQDQESFSGSLVSV